MNSAPYLLAWRSLWDQPRRALALLCGYGGGVAVIVNRPFRQGALTRRLEGS